MVEQRISQPLKLGSRNELENLARLISFLIIGGDEFCGPILTLIQIIFVITASRVRSGGFVELRRSSDIGPLQSIVTLKEGKITLEEGKEFLNNYRSGLYGYTYLE